MVNRTWRRTLLVVVIVALAAATGRAQPASAPLAGPASLAPTPRPPVPDLSPQAQAKGAPAFTFTAPVFDPRADLHLRLADGRTTGFAVRDLSARAAKPRPRIVCGTRILEADDRLDPKMLRHPDANPDPRIARLPPPPCGAAPR